MTTINANIQWNKLPATAYPPDYNYKKEQIAQAEFDRVLNANPAISADNAGFDAVVAAEDFDRVLGSQQASQTIPTPAAAPFEPDTAPAVLEETAPAAGITANAAAEEPEKENGFLSFLKDIIDILNPLQHIPVVSAIYRHITGDTMSPVANIAGGALYGGPIGAGVAVADVAYAKFSGKDFGETAIAMVMPGDAGVPAGTEAPVMVAQNMTAVEPAAGNAQTISMNDIIWDDAGPSQLTPSELALSPPPPTRTSGTGAYELTPPTTSAPQTKGNYSTTLLAQEAPAEYGTKPVPPGLVAQKMMEALDKYKQMKSVPVAPVTASSISETY